VVGGQILGFSIDLRRRPYNNRALPCECVINNLSTSHSSVTMPLVHQCRIRLKIPHDENCNFSETVISQFSTIIGVLKCCLHWQYKFYKTMLIHNPHRDSQNWNTNYHFCVASQQFGALA